MPFLRKLNAWNVNRKIGKEIKRNDAFYQFLKSSFHDSHKVIEILKLNGKERFDVVVSHELLRSGLAGLRAAQAFDAELKLIDIVEYPDNAGRSAHYFFNLAKNDPLGNDLLLSHEARLLALYDHVFATSIGQLEAINRMGIKENCTLLRNARNKENIVKNNKLRNLISAKSDDVIILYCNNVYPATGAEESIAALAHLPEQFHLVFLGEIRTERKKIDEVISLCGVAGRVSILEPVPPAQLIEFSAGADLAIIPLLPSTPNHIYCLPNRVFESIAASNPIIAPAMIETGAFVKEHDIGAVFENFSAEEISRVILEASDRLSRGGFDAPMKKAGEILVWENERRPYVDALGAGQEKSALLVACKSIVRNNRICRLTQELVNIGYETTVIAKDKPMNELQVSDVQYFSLSEY